MMAVRFNKCLNNIPISGSTSTFKEEYEDDFIDDKVFVSETTVVAVNSDYNLITESKVFSAFDYAKTELSLSEEQNNTINDSVKIEEGINPDDIKIEFDNGLLLCEQCHVYYQDYCTECGMVVHILNKDALNNTNNGTQEELPHNILEIRKSFGQFGIFALRVIPKDVKFGPFTGLNTSESNWKLKGGKLIVDEDKSKYLNWMQYVNPARSNFEQNLLTFQYEDNLYYRSIRKIQEGEELLVYFGEKYEDSLKRDIEMDFIPIAEQDFKDVFACTMCCLGFSSRTYLTKHKAICLDDSKGKFSIEELEQCPYCKIYLNKKEYIECHMVYCSQKNIRNCIPLVLDNQRIDVKRDRTRRLQMYNCTQCNYKTKFKGDLESHSYQHCAVKMHKCEICYKRFNTKKYLKMHLENVHINVEGIQFRKYSRSEANGYKSIKTNLEVRKKTKHLKKFKYDCESCGYKTNRKDNFEMHLKSKHLKEFNYKCAMCEYKTNVRQDFVKHTKTLHLKEFDYKCKICDYKTNNNSDLQIHLKSKHLKEFDYKCDICKYKTNRKQNLKIHIKSKHHKEFNKCGMSEYKTNLKFDLEKHAETPHLKEFDYKCEMCEYKTYNNSYLQNHLKSKHLKEFDYKCEICEYKTNNKSHLQAHSKLHLKVFNYKCDMCEYKTNFKRYFEKHTKTLHLKEFDYKCEICEFKTNNKSYLQIHLKSKHLKEFDYQCDKCEYKANRKANLKIHMESKHLKEFNYKCGMCEYKTSTKANLKIHMKRVHIKEFDYKCDMCGFKTNMKTHLEKHTKTVHLKEFDYKCGMCEYKTNVKASFEIHMKGVHLKEFDYKCDMCGYKTNMKAPLERHTKTVHLKEFDYKCGVCEYKTNVKANLKIHMKGVHLKEFDYKCDRCEYKTNIKSCIQIHLKSHLKEFDYECDICEYKTNNIPNFKRHIKRKHSSECNI